MRETAAASDAANAAAPHRHPQSDRRSPLWYGLSTVDELQQPVYLSENVGVGQPAGQPLIMYEQFFGLREKPFALTPNLKYFLLTPQHQEAMSNIEYGLTQGGGITLLLGEAGTGKTTLLRKVLAEHFQRPAATPVRWAYLNNPKLSAYEFLDSVAHAFGLSTDAARSKSHFLREFEHNLAAHRERGGLSVLIVDEAQSLPNDLLEEVRLLANIETDTEKLLRIVLAGQPALGDRLNEAELPQLKQRIGLRCTLSRFNLRETAIYISHRLTLAGGDPAQCFSREAVTAIHERSTGILRTINVLCDNSLLTGFAAGHKPVGRDIVLEVCRDFDLRPSARRSPASDMPAQDSPDTVGPSHDPSPVSRESGASFSLSKLFFKRRR